MQTMHTAFELRGETGILTLNNPPQNFLKKPEFFGLNQLRRIIETTDVKGIIINGNGRHFSAGADIKELKQIACNFDLLKHEIEAGKKLLEYIDSLNIPVIAAVCGVCFGGGLEIALLSHIIVCAENSLFAFPEANYEIMPGLGGSVRLPYRIGAPASFRLLLSGDMIDAQTALGIKLVDYILPNEQVFDYALQLMRKMILGRGLKVINSITESIKNFSRMDFNQAMAEETRLFCNLATDEFGS